MHPIFHLTCRTQNWSIGNCEVLFVGSQSPSCSSRVNCNAALGLISPAACLYVISLFPPLFLFRFPCVTISMCRVALGSCVGYHNRSCVALCTLTSLPNFGRGKVNKQISSTTPKSFHISSIFFLHETQQIKYYLQIPTRM